MNPVPQNHNIILASQSPRRQELLTKLGIPFRLQPSDVEEVYPPELKGEEVALYLCRLKADAFNREGIGEDILITADTIVCVDDLILGKPKDVPEASEMLKLLSGRRHEVITGVCMRSAKKEKLFAITSSVFFKELSEAEIEFYVKEYRPFDKAGAYGVQEWIGLVGIEHIEGSYYNVMGLPVKELYEELQKF